MVLQNCNIQIQGRWLDALATTKLKVLFAFAIISSSTTPRKGHRTVCKCDWTAPRVVRPLVQFTSKISHDYKIRLVACELAIQCTVVGRMYHMDDGELFVQEVLDGP